MGFIFGENTDTPTYQSLQRKRQIADMLAQQSLSPTNSMGGAISQIGQALIAKFADRKLKPQEDAERDRVSQQMAQLQSHLGPEGISQGDYGSLADIGNNPYAPPGIEGIARMLMRRKMMPEAGAIPGYARGTNFARGGMAMVGEEGPELVRLPRGSQVMPNDMMAGDPRAMYDAARKARGNYGVFPTPENEEVLSDKMQQFLDQHPRDPAMQLKGQEMDGWADDPANWEGGLLSQNRPGNNQVAQADTGTQSDASTNMKLTEGQSKNLNFWNRMDATSGDIDKYAPDLMNRGEQIKNAVPMIGNSLVSEGYQRGRRAGEEWLISVLRPDTGAAVTPEEWDRYAPTYLPQPGDSPGMVADKTAARKRAAEGLKRGLGLAEVLADELGAQRQKAAPPAAGGAEDWQTKDPSTWTDEQLKEFTGG